MGKVGGHTPIGVELNRQSQKTANINVDKVNFRRAIIHKSVGDTYIFTMRLLDNNKITQPIPIVGSANDLSMRFGSPSEMEQEWEVLITYKGNSVNRGTAQVIGPIGSSLTSLSESSKQSNQLLIKGTAFAPPGPGM